MISNRWKATLATILLCLSSAAVARAQMSSVSDSDAAGIKQCVAAWEDAWNRHDAHATAMAYVEDGDFSSTTCRTRLIPSHVTLPSPST